MKAHTLLVIPLLLSAIINTSYFTGTYTHAMHSMEERHNEKLQDLHDALSSTSRKLRVIIDGRRV